MLKKASFASIALTLVVALLAIAVARNPAFPQKASVPKSQASYVLADDDVKRLMLLVAPNEHGKITKHEWMKFMEAEFDRLDKDKSGELDAKELSQSRVRVSPFATTGK